MPNSLRAEEQQVIIMKPISFVERLFNRLKSNSLKINEILFSSETSFENRARAVKS